MVRLIILLSILYTGITHANEDKHFMDRPAQISKPMAMAVLRMASENRNYLVKDVDGSTLEISMKNRVNHFVKLRFSFLGNKISYKDLSISEEENEYEGGSDKEWVHTSAPNGWIQNLQSDVKANFAMLKLMKLYLDDYLSKTTGK